MKSTQPTVTHGTVSKINKHVAKTIFGTSLLATLATQAHALTIDVQPIVEDVGDGVAAAVLIGTVWLGFVAAINIFKRLRAAV